MNNLSKPQIANLYALHFIVSESDLSSAIADEINKKIDNALKLQNYPPATDTVYDNDGVPAIEDKEVTSFYYNRLEEADTDIFPWAEAVFVGIYEADEKLKDLYSEEAFQEYLKGLSNY